MDQGSNVKFTPKKITIKPQPKQMYSVEGGINLKKKEISSSFSIHVYKG